MESNNNTTNKKRQRAFSHRSRTGCFTCRKRRIKCDERKPVCKNCNRGQRQCKFPFSSSSGEEGSPNMGTSQMNMDSVPAFSMPPLVQPASSQPSQPTLRDTSSPIMNQHQQQHYQQHRGGLDPSNATGHHMPTLPPIASMTSPQLSPSQQQQQQQQPMNHQQYNQLNHQHLHNYYQQVYGHVNRSHVPSTIGVPVPLAHYQQHQHQPPVFNTPYNTPYDGYNNNIHHINIHQQANNRTISHNPGVTSLQQHQHHNSSPHQTGTHVMLPYFKTASANQQRQPLVSRHLFSQSTPTMTQSSTDTSSGSESSTNGNLTPNHENSTRKHSFHLN